MALKLVVYELFAEVPSGWRSLGFFYTEKEAKKYAKDQTRPTTIEKKII